MKTENRKQETDANNRQNLFIFASEMKRYAQQHGI